MASTQYISPFPAPTDLYKAMTDFHEALMRGLSDDRLISDMPSHHTTIVRRQVFFFHRKLIKIIKYQMRILKTHDESKAGSPFREVLDRSEFTFLWRFITQWIEYARDKNATPEVFLLHQKANARYFGFHCIPGPLPQEPYMTTSSAALSSIFQREESSGRSSGNLKEGIQKGRGTVDSWHKETQEQKVLERNSQDRADDHTKGQICPPTQLPTARTWKQSEKTPQAMVNHVREPSDKTGEWREEQSTVPVRMSIQCI